MKLFGTGLAALSTTCTGVWYQLFVDQPDVILAKWKFVLNHVRNSHAGHDDLLFSKCVHGKLRGRDAKKKWLKPSAKPASKLD